MKDKIREIQAQLVYTELLVITGPVDHTEENVQTIEKALLKVREDAIRECAEMAMNHAQPENSEYMWKACGGEIAEDILSLLKKSEKTIRKMCISEERCGKCSECHSEGFYGPGLKEPK